MLFTKYLSVDSLKSKWGVALQLSGGILNAGSGLVITLIFAKTLGVTQYGYLALATSLISATMPIGAAGMKKAVLYTLGRSRREKILQTALVIEFIASLLQSGIAYTVGYLFYPEEIRTLLLLLSIICFFSSADIFESELLLDGNIKRIGYANMIKAFSGFAACAVFTATNFISLKTCIFVLTLQSGLRFYYLYKCSSIGSYFILRPLRGFDHSLCQKLLNVGTPALLSAFSVAGLTNIGELVIGLFNNSQAVAEFSIASKVVGGFSIIPMTVLWSLYPRISSDPWDIQQRLVLRSRSLRVGLVTTFLSLGVSPIAISLLLSGQFTYSPIVSCILSVGCATTALRIYWSMILLSRGREAWSACLEGSTLLLSFISTYYGFISGGIIGAAIGTTLGQIASLVAWSRYLLKGEA